jgi:hypothetical protein
MNIALIASVAILIEGLVEYGKTIVDAFTTDEKKTAITQLITIVIGILLAFAFNADMFIPIGIEVNHTVGMILTGIVMSRGSNYVSDLLNRISNPVKE